MPVATNTTWNQTALICFLGTLVGFGPLSIDMYLPSLPTIAQALHTSIEWVQLSVSTFLTGFCVGMLFYGPLSDKYGRRIILLIGMTIYIVASIACSIATSIEQLLVARFLQAFGGGVGPVLGRAIVRDSFPPQRITHVLSMMQLVTMLAPLLAPFIGGIVLLWFGWETQFLLLALIGVVCWLIAYFFLAETNQDRHQRPLNLGTFFQAYCGILKQPQSFGNILCLSAMFGGMFAYVAGTPFVYIDYFHIPPQDYGFYFGINVVGIVLATLINNYCVKRYAVQRVLMAEMGLVALAGMAFFLTDPDSLFAIMLPLFIFVGLTGAITPNVMTSLLKQHSHAAGAAMALAASMQFAGGFVASGALSYFFNNSPQTMLWVMSTCAGVAIVGFMITLKPNSISS
ncbi:Bcr/CflA family multidrug efflux MFS transporter [Pasteurella multocida]|uniref:Bcr/CflA family multidrug efflux MFS transporter n=1 Tax=Pasteurella multocida TaxID=747 RepID=UPI002B476BD6|nr:Bcr/CflA family multidrug efflux MFS transporter [Pasteurella multocida]MEB3476694.1 Bcr/CflA family multidrug efflux MFS transporter [Pasteurella multocida]MEB3508208.1 Bcr/CflA family multidrug efflux MFS transporter [Pasteurella multocida]WRJ98551.1 Bcr/CflA family multidrug efflux MFS transporter [Pasteurella multocida]